MHRGGAVHDASARELWSLLGPALRRAQKTYMSWTEYGEHYCRGREFTVGDAEDAREAYAELLSDARSPWRRPLR